MEFCLLFLQFGNDQGTKHSGIELIYQHHLWQNPMKITEFEIKQDWAEPAAFLHRSYRNSDLNSEFWSEFWCCLIFHQNAVWDSLSLSSRTCPAWIPVEKADGISNLQEF